VEGDLGMRVSAPGVVAESVAERLIEPEEAEFLNVAATHRHSNVDFIPTTAEESRVDQRIAQLAVTIAIRRHLRMIDNQLGPKGAGLLVLSGGVFRHATGEITPPDDPLLRPILRTAKVVVDKESRLGPAGLLSQAGHHATAKALLAPVHA
jgi:hypothetical protein